MTSHKVSRLLRLAATVKTEPQQTIEMLCRTLGVKKAQFYRDKAELEKIAFHFKYDRTQKRFLIEQEPFLPVYNLTLTETFALAMAVRQLSAAGDYILTYDALAAIKKIVANAHGAQRELLVESLHEAVLHQGFGCRAEVLEDLHKATIEQRRVILLYSRPGEDQPQERTIDPYQIYFKRRALYLDAYSPETGSYLVFRVNRISDVQQTGIGFTRHADYNFSQRHRHAFSVFVGDTVERVRVRFSRRIAPYIREVCWHHSQQLTEEPGGSVLFEVEVSSPSEVGWWVLQWGADAEVLEPESLRQELRETAEQLLRLYRKSQPVKNPALDDAME